MFDQQFYQLIAKVPTKSLTLAIISILFFTGIYFTFIIPGLKGFDYVSLIIVLMILYVVANIVVCFLGKYYFKQPRNGLAFVA